MFTGFGLTKNSCRPAAAENVFVAIIPKSDRRNQHGERRKQRGPRFFAHHFVGDDEDVARELRKAAGFAADAAQAGAQTVEEFFLIARAGDLGVRSAGGGQRVRVTAANPDFAPLPGELRGVLIGTLEHVAIADFHGGKIFPEPGEVFEFAAAGDARENVIDTEEEPALGEIHQERDEIVAALLKLYVLALGYVVNPDVHFGAAGHFTGEFFADKKIRMLAQLLGAFDGIVIGEREKIHAPALQEGVNFLRIAITFAAKLLDKRGSTCSGEVRVNMQVAFHVSKNNRRVLREDDTRAKVLKMQIFNSFDTVTVF